MTAGLRDRKKRATRSLVADVATSLFIEQGFEATTIAQIAERAGVAKMTVTNHFPLKEDLLFDRAPEIVALLADAVGESPAGTPAAEAVHEVYRRRLAARWPPLGFGSRPFAVLVADSPALRARHREMSDEQEGALAEVLVARARDTGAPEVPARIEAARLAGVVRILTDEAWRMILDGADRDAVARALDGLTRDGSIWSS